MLLLLAGSRIVLCSVRPTFHTTLCKHIKSNLKIAGETCEERCQSASYTRKTKKATEQDISHAFHLALFPKVNRNDDRWSDRVSQSSPQLCSKRSERQCTSSLRGKDDSPEFD